MVAVPEPSNFQATSVSRFYAQLDGINRLIFVYSFLLARLRSIGSTKPRRVLVVFGTDASVKFHKLLLESMKAFPVKNIEVLLKESGVSAGVMPTSRLLLASGELWGNGLDCRVEGVDCVLIYEPMTLDITDFKNRFLANIYGDMTESVELTVVAIIRSGQGEREFIAELDRQFGWIHRPLSPPGSKILVQNELRNCVKASYYLTVAANEAYLAVVNLYSTLSGISSYHQPLCHPDIPNLAASFALETPPRCELLAP